jgi:hypothetical protein
MVNVSKRMGLWLPLGSAPFLMSAGLLVGTAALFAACQTLSVAAGPSTGLEAEAALAALISKEVGQAPCDNDSQCKTLPMGEKDCGGPEYWLPWSTQLGRPEQLRQWSTELAAAQRRRYLSTGERSNCRYNPDPGAICVAKRCVLKTADKAS